MKIVKYFFFPAFTSITQQLRGFLLLYFCQGINYTNKTLKNVINKELNVKSKKPQPSL